MLGPAQAPTPPTETRHPQRRTVLTTHRQTHKPGGLLKQVRMPTRALESDFVVVQFVDEQPVRFKMAFAPILVVALQRVITIAFRQRFFVDQRRQELFEFFDIFPAALE